nr:immunoglobulin heavy chain junction region [Macaca mulatta]
CARHRAGAISPYYIDYW